MYLCILQVRTHMDIMCIYICSDVCVWVANVFLYACFRALVWVCACFPGRQSSSQATHFTHVPLLHMDRIIAVLLFSGNFPWAGGS